MGITIKDVAKRSGMSISTVSKVFNNYPDISRETRSHVLKAARALGYQPNALARALKTNRSYNLGVLFSDESLCGLTQPFFAMVLNAFKTEAEARGYDITFINHNIGASEMTYLEHCRYRNVDGVCLTCVDFTAEEVEALVSSDIPTVTVDHLYNDRTCVLADNLAGIRMLVDHAVGLGHRRIAFIHGQGNSSITRKRVEGYRRAMEMHGMPVRPGYVAEALYNNSPLTKQKVSEMLALPEPPTCILLPDDTCFFGALEAAAERGIRVPEQLSLAGFDGIDLMQHLRPKITTVWQDTETMGREAAMRLIEAVERGGDVRVGPLMIPVKLLEGETVVRVPLNL